jgi:hypothetical protein
MPYHEALLKLGVDEVKRLKDRYHRVYVEGQHQNYIENPNFFLEELSSKDVPLLDEDNKAYEKIKNALINAEKKKGGFMNNNDIQDTARAIPQGEREAIWVEKMLTYGDGIVLVGDNHVDRVVEALEKKGKKACACLNFYDIKLALEGSVSLEEAVAESLAVLADHTRRNWPQNLGKVEEYLLSLGRLLEP